MCACSFVLFPLPKISPALLQNLVGENVLIFRREIWREIRRDSSFPPQYRLKIFGQNFGAFFARKFLAQRKSCVQNALWRRATLTKSVSLEGVSEFSEIPTRGRSRGGRCANLSQIARQICAKLPVCRFVHQRKGAQNCRKFVANLKVNLKRKIKSKENWKTKNARKSKKARIGGSGFMQIPLFQCPFSKFLKFGGADKLFLFGCGTSSASIRFAEVHVCMVGRVVPDNFKTLTTHVANPP